MKSILKDFLIFGLLFRNIAHPKTSHLFKIFHFNHMSHAQNRE